MCRAMLLGFVALSTPASSWAQDMPLSQILLEGERWQRAEGKPVRPHTRAVRLAGTLVHQTYRYDSYAVPAASGKELLVHAPPVLVPPQPGNPQDIVFVPAVAVADRLGTVFVGLTNNPLIWIAPPNRPGPTPGSEVSAIPQPFCPLRLPQGDKATGVTGLAADVDGRIYVATPLGVQVFDPSGRLCGVLHLPAPGKLEHLTFEGDRLTGWVGGTKYIRRLNTRGVE